ncbi:MAG: DUF2516 family protein [Nocardioides sp.]|uniref:DUF2516 family protein n=1 Tax=Nocardioides sp. TaxID=35761 RepID=UPI003F0D0813
MWLIQMHWDVMSLIALALLVVKVVALVSAVAYSAEAYAAADKLTKTTWCVILGVGLAIDVLLGWGILAIVATVAAFVYLADVRPALREVTAHGR